MLQRKPPPSQEGACTLSLTCPHGAPHDEEQVSLLLCGSRLTYTVVVVAAGRWCVQDCGLRIGSGRSGNAGACRAAAAAGHVVLHMLLMRHKHMHAMVTFAAHGVRTQGCAVRAGRLWHPSRRGADPQGRCRLTFSCAPCVALGHPLHGSCSHAAVMGAHATVHCLRCRMRSNLVLDCPPGGSQLHAHAWRQTETPSLLQSGN